MSDNESVEVTDDELQSETDSDMGYMIHLKDIKTIRELYDGGVLKIPAKTEPSGSGSGSTTPAVDSNTDATGSTSSPAPKVEADSSRPYPANPALLERVSLFQGDITQLAVDTIVNAANKSLLGGGGVDGAIHHAAGPKLLAECRQLNGARTGESKITRGYNLPAGHVIHTVGPVYAMSEREEKAKLLASCYRTSLELAVEHSLKHVAFPSVSTGIYGYPIKDATHIALRTTRNFLDTRDGEKLDRVIFVVWSNPDKEVYMELIPHYFPPAQND